MVYLMLYESSLSDLQALVHAKSRHPKLSVHALVIGIKPVWSSGAVLCDGEFLQSWSSGHTCALSQTL